MLQCQLVCREIALSDTLNGRWVTAPCNHLVVYETDLGGRSVFLRTNESLAGCFPLELFVIELAPSSELSSVRSERSVNSISAGVDMGREKEAVWAQDQMEPDRGDCDATRRWLSTVTPTPTRPSSLFRSRPL